MILSSADILRVLGGSEIIRLSAKLKIVDGKPTLSGAEGLFIYIDRFPRTDEFQATWSIYIESDGSEPDDLVLAEIKKLLPGVKVRAGLMTTVTTTDFLSENTQRPPEAPKQVQAQADLTQYEERFQELVEDVQDRMLLVTSGRAGRDGKDGVDGAPGRDGRDIDATETNLEDLRNVGSEIPKKDGQVLTWKDGIWQNLHIPQVLSTISGGGGSSAALVSDAPPTQRDNGSALEEGDLWFESDTGALHVYYNSAWVEIAGGGGGGSTTLAGLLDTNVQAPADQEILSWNSTSGAWENIALTHPSAPVDSVNGQTGAVVLNADHIDDSATTNKFVTSSQLTEIGTALQPGDIGTTVQGFNADTVVDASYVHTDNNYTTTEKNKLAGIAAGAEANVNADWNAVSGDAQILNKPTLGTAAAANTSDFATAAQGAKADTAVQPGGLATVATTGAYSDLTGTPSIPASIDDLSDVDTSTTAPSVGQVLEWDGTNWIPADAATGGTVASLNDIDDVDVGTATGGQYLQYDGANWVPVTGSAGGLSIDDVRLDAENQTFGYTDGALTSVTGTQVQVAIVYNPDSTVQSVTKTSNGTSVTKTFGYDGNGNLISTTVS